MPKTAASQYSVNDKSPFDRCVAKVLKKLKGKDSRYPGQSKLQRARAICAATMRKAHPEEFAAAQEAGRKAAAKKSKKAGRPATTKKTSPKKSAVKRTAKKGSIRLTGGTGYKAALGRLSKLLDSNAEGSCNGKKRGGYCGCGCS